MRKWKFEGSMGEGTLRTRHPPPQHQPHLLPTAVRLFSASLHRQSCLSPPNHLPTASRCCSVSGAHARSPAPSLPPCCKFYPSLFVWYQSESEYLTNLQRKDAARAVDGSRECQQKGFGNGFAAVDHPLLLLYHPVFMCGPRLPSLRLDFVLPPPTASSTPSSASCFLTQLTNSEHQCWQQNNPPISPYRRQGCGCD